jgi:hypothetical protein
MFIKRYHLAGVDVARNREAVRRAMARQIHDTDRPGLIIPLR